MSPLQVACKEECPSPEPSFVTFRTPSKEAPPPPGSPNRAPIERDAPFPETPYSYLSEFPVNEPPCGDVPPLSPPPHILPNPQKGAPLTELPQREMLPFQSSPTVS